jgi:mono/diheme cytochrome c family protein
MRGMSVIFAAAGAILAAGHAWAAGQIELPPGPNRQLVYGKCRTCHDLQYLKESAGITRNDWDDMLISMRQYGLRIPKEQRAKILDYLGTYLGPNPPPASAASAPAETAAADGATVFQEQCSACHQPKGQGVAGQFPPLAGNRDLFLSETFPAMVVLFGLEGKISVDSKTYQAAMPPFGHLSDDEIAAVLRYIRGAWGNSKLRPDGFKDADPAAIAKIRSREMTVAEVHKSRQSLK